LPRNDPRAKCSDADFIQQFKKLGATALGQKLNSTKHHILRRRRALEKLYRIQITSPKTGNATVTRHNIEHAARLHFDVSDGVVLIGSDAHIWPGPLTTAMRAFIKFAGQLKPKAVVLNGDVLDFPQVSRHAPIGWEEHPTVADEIEAANSALEKIEAAVSRNCALFWTLGNHDGRLETRIATTAPELAKLKGVHLKDHFSPRWRPCWSVWINDVVVKHRLSGGIGAARNNTVKSGMSIVTGHLHSLKVTPYTDYRGTRYGVDSGCLADPAAEAFVHYTEDGPLDWRSGFVVLTFKDGALLPPELVTVWQKNAVVFRGQIYNV